MCEEEIEKRGFASKEYTQGFIDALNCMLQFHSRMLEKKDSKECRECTLFYKAKILLKRASEQRCLHVLMDIDALDLA
ncbi:hypothetical protein DRO19_02770 [Candidatus Bathyarchaeota archaeon]|nr:MAG: hypothetical protein DRO19_02770 [Candidatus Bathyarchaeota archaeon]